MTKATVLIEENHNLIYSYLHKMRLDIKEVLSLALSGMTQRDCRTVTCQSGEYKPYACLY